MKTMTDAELKIEGLKIAIKRLESERDCWFIVYPEILPGTLPSFCVDTLNQAIRTIKEIDIPSVK